MLDREPGDLHAVLVRGRQEREPHDGADPSAGEEEVPCAQGRRFQLRAGPDRIGCRDEGIGAGPDDEPVTLLGRGPSSEERHRGDRQEEEAARANQK